MTIEWTPEKVNACAALYGNLNWKIGVGDRCVLFDELGNDPQDIQLVNNVGSDSVEFMRGKVWLLTSDDIERILCGMGYDISVSILREKNVGGIAHTTTVTASSNSSSPVTTKDSDPHLARLKLLQRVVNKNDFSTEPDIKEE